MKKILIFIIVIIGLGLAWWLGSPLFINKEVNEELSPELEQAVEEAIEEFKGNLDEQIQDEEQMSEFKKEMEVIEDMPEVVDGMPEVSHDPEVLKVGSFIDVAHHGSGEAKIINLGSDNGTILRLVDLDVSNGPDLRVLLSKSSDVQKSSDLGEYVELGKLKGNRGTQNYTIPEGVDVSEYASAVVYCKPFHVVFNSANLE